MAVKRRYQQQTVDIDVLPGSQILPAGDAASVLGRSIQTMRNWRKQNIGPRPVLLVKGRNSLGDRYGYRVKDLRDWLNQCAAA